DRKRPGTYSGRRINVERISGGVRLLEDSEHREGNHSGQFELFQYHMFGGIAIAIPELVVFSGASPQLLREFQLRASIQMQEFRPADALQRNGGTWIQQKVISRIGNPTFGTMPPGYQECHNTRWGGGTRRSPGRCRTHSHGRNFFAKERSV